MSMTPVREDEREAMREILTAASGGVTIEDVVAAEDNSFSTRTRAKATLEDLFESGDVAHDVNSQYYLV